jgi:hypothetical protein
VANAKARLAAAAADAAPYSSTKLYLCERAPCVSRHAAMIEISIIPRAADVTKRRTGGTPRWARIQLAAMVGTTTASC